MIVARAPIGLGYPFALLSLFRDPAVVLKDELKWIPLYGWFCLKFAHILVKRDKASLALKALIRDARNRIACDRQILIFPEGTRTAPDAPPGFKPGYVALYEALGVPVVPLALNSGLYWPRRQYLWRYPAPSLWTFCRLCCQESRGRRFRQRSRTPCRMPASDVDQESHADADFAEAPNSAVANSETLSVHIVNYLLTKMSWWC